MRTSMLILVLLRFIGLAMAAIEADAFCLPSLDSPPDSPRRAPSPYVPNSQLHSTFPPSPSQNDSEQADPVRISSYDGNSRAARRPRSLMGISLTARRTASQSFSELL
eukprot:IDg10635t1